MLENISPTALLVLAEVVVLLIAIVVLAVKVRQLNTRVLHLSQSLEHALHSMQPAPAQPGIGDFGASNMQFGVQADAEFPAEPSGQLQYDAQYGQQYDAQYGQQYEQYDQQHGQPQNDQSQYGAQYGQQYEVEPASRREFNMPAERGSRMPSGIGSGPIGARSRKDPSSRQAPSMPSPRINAVNAASAASRNANTSAARDISIPRGQNTEFGDFPGAQPTGLIPIEEQRAAAAAALAEEEAAFEAEREDSGRINKVQQKREKRRRLSGGLDDEPRDISKTAREQAAVQASWIKAEERRYAERMTRQQRSRDRREERQQARLRERAEAIVQAHIDNSDLEKRQVHERRTPSSFGRPNHRDALSYPVGEGNNVPLGYRQV